MSALERTLGKQHAVVGQYGDRIAPRCGPRSFATPGCMRCKAALNSSKPRTVHDSGDHLLTPRGGPRARPPERFRAGVPRCGIMSRRLDRADIVSSDAFGRVGDWSVTMRRTILSASSSGGDVVDDPGLASVRVGSPRPGPRQVITFAGCGPSPAAVRSRKIGSPDRARSPFHRSLPAHRRRRPCTNP